MTYLDKFTSRRGLAATLALLLLAGCHRSSTKTPSATKSTVTVSATGSVVADGQTAVTITVVVLDEGGAPLGGRTVAFSVSGTGHTLTPTTATTDAAGKATASLVSTKAETKTVTVTVDPSGAAVVLTARPTITFVGDASAISASASSVTASPTSGVAADGTTTSTITVTVKDTHGNPVPGVTVQLAANGTGNTLTQPATATDSSGVATGTLASTKAETKTITATADPAGTAVALADQPTVTFVGDASSISAGNSTVVASPAGNVVADGVAKSTITVTVKDTHGNPVPGVTVQLAASGTGNTLTQPAAVTDASGVATGTIASTKAETKTITATADPGGNLVVITQQPTVTFVADASSISASNSSVAVSPATGVRADGSTTTTITVTVRDAHGNPVSGQTVQLAATGTANTLTQPPATTNASGEATGTLASTSAEIKTITATVNPGGSAVVIDQKPTVTFVSIFDPDDATAIHGTSSGQALMRTWDDSAGTWSAGAGVGAAADVRWSVHAMRPGGWLGSGWAYRKKLTLQASQVAGSVDLHDFVVLVSITDVDLASKAQDDGDDLVFTAANGTTRLSHEIESFDGATGKLVAWVQVPVLGATADTEIYLYYGNGAVGSQQDAAGVWDEGFVAVYHLANAYDGTPGEVRDSTAGAHHGVAGSAPARVAGKIGNGQDFEDTVGHYLTIAHGGALDLTGADDRVTFSAWVKPESAGTWQTVLSKGASAPYDHWFGLRNVSPARLDFELGDVALSTSSMTTGAWHHLAGTWDRTTMRMYIDGVEDVTTQPKATAVPDSSDTTTIGAVVGGAGSLMDGVLDEVRIARVARSSAWITTEFRNQNDPGSFLTVGTEETGSGEANEQVLVTLASVGGTSSLEARTASAGTWTLGWSTSGISPNHVDKRAFDVAYEDVSGDALVVYGNDTATPRYRTFSGGAWSAEQALPLNDAGGPNPDPNTGAVRWVELEPREGSDEIALAYSDANSDLVVLVWDGAQWKTSTVATLETDLKRNPITGQVSNRVFDVAFENQTGKLMAAWSRHTTSGFWWSTLAPGGSSWSTAQQVASAPGGGIPHHVDLAAEPGGKRIAGGFFDLGDGVERLGLATWDGSTWLHPGEYDSQTRNVNDTATGDFPGALAWVGKSGVAVCVYSDDATQTLDWARWTAAGGWVLQSDVAVAGKGYTESVVAESFHGKDAILVLVSDDAADLRAFTYDGTSWTQTNGGAALETSLPWTNTVPFSLAIRRQ